VALPLPNSHGTQGCAAVLLVPNCTEAQADELLLRLELAKDVPGAYHANQANRQAAHQVETFSAVMDVLSLVNHEQRFLAAGLAFCNALATRFQCERVSLGWLEAGYIRMKNISRTERFNREMSAIKAMEMAMEECLDQDAELLWPAPEGFPLIVKDTQALVEGQRSAHALSVPLRVAEEVVAVVLCERQGAPFSQMEIDQIRLGCDQVARRLSELQRVDRWFGARWKYSAGKLLAKSLGPEHTWAKVFALLGAVGLVGLLLPLYPYRVEGNFILRSDEVSYLSAPFDGYIRATDIRPGDLVSSNGVLLRLNTEDLEMEEASAIADQTKYIREAEKARAAKSLAEMRIAQAQADQSKARLDMVRYRVTQATIRAPFDGVIIEGDLRQRLGAPVKQGDALFRVGRAGSLYVEAEINERDIHEISPKSAGAVAFVAQPKYKYPVTIARIEPASVPKEKQNVFLVRCIVNVPPEAWWRPGMSGVCKLDVERRTLLWVITHRTVDFLRLKFWM